MLVAWQVLQPPVPSAMWLADPAVPTAPGGTTAVTPYHAMAEAWQVSQVSALTAVCSVADSAGVGVSLKPPCEVELALWQPTQVDVNPLCFITVLAGRNGAVVPWWQFVQPVFPIGMWFDGSAMFVVKLVVEA